MKFTKTITAILALICSSVLAQAGSGRSSAGHHNSYGASYLSTAPSSSLGTSSRSYTYKNPYAAFPSDKVSGYTRSNGTVVDPYSRTTANSTQLDNLSYRGFGTVKVPKSTFGE